MSRIHEFKISLQPRHRHGPQEKIYIGFRLYPSSSDDPYKAMEIAFYKP